jgi:metallo-beta-lactamase superfamily protein
MLVATPAAGRAIRSAGLESHAKALAVLDSGVRAIGGIGALRGTKTVLRRLSGDWYGSGQGRRPEPFSGPTRVPPASNGRTQLESFVDYGRGRSLDETIESDFSGDSITRVSAVAEASGFESITYRDERPYLRTIPSADLAALRVRRLRRHPEGILLMASGRTESLQWVGSDEESGRRQEVISFADAAGSRVLLYLDASTHRLTKTETVRSHAIAGDTTAEVLYDDYRQVGGLMLPFHYVDRVAGVPTEETRVSAIELGVAVQEERFAPPTEFARIEDDPAGATLQPLGDGLYLVRGPYNVLFAVYSDHVVVFEAPLNSRYSETILDLVRTVAPDKPVRFLVASHFHFDHVGGVRPYVLRNSLIITTPDTPGVIERVVSARPAMNADALSRNPKMPRFETVTGERVLDDGTFRAEIYDFGPTEHVDRILVTFFPKQGVLFVADLWDVISMEMQIAGADAALLARRIEERSLRVQRIIPVHGSPATMRMLQDGLAIRAKYSNTAPEERR